MSLRPRPVTATVTKPKWMEPQGVRRRSWSQESNGSTASLTSVLDHDSYVSPDLSDAEWEDKDKNDSEEKNKDNHAKETFSEEDKEIIHRKLAEFEDSTFTEHSNSEKEEKLSPWEQWLIRKTKSERVKRKEIQREKNEDRLKQEEEKRLNEAKTRKALQKRQKWLEEKNYEEKLRKKLEKQRLRTQKELQIEKEIKVAEKSEQTFKKWKAEKNKQLKEKFKTDKQRTKEEEKEQEKRREQAEQKYKQWLYQSKNRPKSVPNSFGYTSGKLTGYHDTSAYPPPNFYNPIPWHHPPAPTKSERNKKNTTKSKPKKYVWNPDKYF